MRHFDALVRIDTTDPPGNETRVVDYLKKVFTAEGIPFIVAAKDPARANIIARLKGNGSKRPLLIVGHSDTVKVDPAKWTCPPFSAAHYDGWVYGRGTLDDKSDLVVTDKKGNYVRDLTQKDFKVFEDNKEQTITSFSHETGASAQDDSRKHYTVLFFGESTAGASLQSYARQAARDLIRANTVPNRMMAIADFTAALRVTQNFTDDPDRLTQALAGSGFAASRSTAGAASLNDFATR
jgi:hypothetical protein